METGPPLITVPRSGAETGWCTYSVGHPSGVSLAISAVSIAAAASGVTHSLQTSTLPFSHHSAESFAVASMFSLCHAATALYRSMSNPQLRSMETTSGARDSRSGPLRSG